MLEDIAAYARALGENARESARTLRALPVGKRNAALKALAASLVKSQAAILEENAKDLEEGRAQGLSAALLDRLLLTPERIRDIAENVKVIAGLARSRWAACWRRRRAGTASRSPG